MLSETDTKNFETLVAAGQSGHLLLMECIDERTNTLVSVICAYTVDDEGVHTMVPFAQLYDGTQYEFLKLPTDED